MEETCRDMLVFGSAIAVVLFSVAAMWGAVQDARINKYECTQTEVINGEAVCTTLEIKRG